MQFALPSSKAAAPFSKIPPAQLFSLRLSCTSLLWKCHLPLLDTPIFLSLEIPSSNRDTTFWNGAPCSKELPFSNGYLSSQAGLLFFPHFLMYRSHSFKIAEAGTPFCIRTASKKSASQAKSAPYFCPSFETP